MVTRDDIVEAARAYIGVRWRHQGRTVRNGLDCFGLIIRVGEDVGMPVEDVPARYSRIAKGLDLVEQGKMRGLRVPLPEARPGDVLLLHQGVYPCHIAIRSEKRGKPYMIHSHAGRGRVMEEPILGEWERQLVMAFGWRGVE